VKSAWRYSINNPDKLQKGRTPKRCRPLFLSPPVVAKYRATGRDGIISVEPSFHAIQFPA